MLFNKDDYAVFNTYSQGLNRRRVHRSIPRGVSSAPCFGLNAQVYERTGILTQGALEIP